MKPLSVIPATKESFDFEAVVRLNKAALESAVVRFVRNSGGKFPERIRMASDLSGIPRGVIEELVKVRP